MADFAFKRQDESKVITSGTTQTVPLTCHGHSRPITHLGFSTALNTASTSPQYYMISACKDQNPMLRDGLTGDWIGTFIGHKGAVWSARLSEDATLAATGSADFSAKVWDTFTGETLVTLDHPHIVRAVAFPPGQRPGVLATGGQDKKLRVFDISSATNAPSNSDAAPTANGSTGSDCPSYEIGVGDHQGSIKSIIWTRDPNFLVTACEDKNLRWYDLRTGRTVATFPLAAAPTSCELNAGLDNNPDGTIAVAAGKNVYFFSGSQPGQLLSHIATDREVASVALNGAARRFVTGCATDTWVHVWDYDAQQEVETGKGHHGPVWTTGFSPDGKLYATGSEDGTIKLWKSAAGGYGLWR
jgi:serine-threonine kinase receptor-associated protein